MTSAANMHFVHRETRLRASFFLYLGVFIVASMAACSPVEKDSIVRLDGQTMGTTYHVALRSNGIDQTSLKNAIDQRLLEINASMSTYIDDSEINRLSRSPVGEVLHISEELCEVLTISRGVFDMTDGAFDPTVRPLVDLWGFGSELREFSVPDPDSVATQLQYTGFQNLEFDCEYGTATRLADITLDLSAVAKGYGVDVVSGLLLSSGIVHFMVEIGGEVRLSGRKPGDELWRIAIEKPSVNDRELDRVLELSDRAMATSGDYRNFFEIDGVSYSHTIDPKTGYPVSNGVSSSTVLAETTAEADAYATAFLVMGMEKTLALAEKRDIAVYLLVKGEDDYQALMSSAFERALALNNLDQEQRN
ncbi:MAG: FAD:protein FMN transferase [bacterium]